MADEATNLAPVSETPEATEGSTPATPTAAEVAKKIWRLKVDGKEFDFDASDEAALKKQVELAHGSTKRFQEAAAKDRRAEQFFQLLQTDPKSILTNPKLGIDFKKIAEDYLWEQMQEEKMTPEDRSRRDIQRERDELKAEKARREQESKDAEFQTLVQQYETKFEADVMTALDSQKVPKTRKTVQRMGEYMRLAMANNIDINAQDLVNHVRQEIAAENKETWGGVSDDDLLSMVGEDLAKRLRDIDLKRLKSTQGSQFQTPPPKASIPSGANGQVRVRKLSGHDWRNELMREAGLAKRRN